MNELVISTYIQILQEVMIEHDKQETAGSFLLESISTQESANVVTDLSAKKISRLVHRQDPVPDDIKRAALKKTVQNGVYKYFEKKVLPDLNPFTVSDAFRFGDVEYSFARSTTDYMYVIPCDRAYKALQDQQKLHIDEFRQFLSDMYGIDAEGLTWRGLMSKFIRVFRRDTMDLSCLIMRLCVALLHSLSNSHGGQTLICTITPYRYTITQTIV